MGIHELLQLYNFNTLSIYLGPRAPWTYLAATTSRNSYACVTRAEYRMPASTGEPPRQPTVLTDTRTGNGAL